MKLALASGLVALMLPFAAMAQTSPPVQDCAPTATKTDARCGGAAASSNTASPARSDSMSTTSSPMQQGKPTTAPAQSGAANGQGVTRP